MTNTVYRCTVSKGKSLAGIGISVCRLEDRHCIIVSAVLNVHDTRYSGCEIGSIVLILSCSERLLKGLLLVHKLVDGIGLVAVGNDGLVAKNSYGRVDDKMGIGQL